MDNSHVSMETYPTAPESMQISHTGSITLFHHQHRMIAYESYVASQDTLQTY